MRQRIAVTTLGIIGGLLVLLMLAAVACDNPPAMPSTTGAHSSVGICDGTEQVRDAILERTDGVDDCAAVTATHLSAIDGTI